MNGWTEDRLARAALASLLSYGATQVLALAADMGAQQAWDAIKQAAGRAAPPKLPEAPPPGAEQVAGAGEAPILAGLDGDAVPTPRRGPLPSRDALMAWASTVEPLRVADETERAGLRFLIPGDDEWPESLSELGLVDIDSLGGLPVGLWVAGPGHLARWSQQAVAMVGARAATRYGEAVAMRMASELAADADVPHWTIVSGGAYGIDAASHRGALLMNGRTIGVFANGLGSNYPPGNASLIESIKRQGLAVSELPPSAHPTRQGFLSRNRIVAALSQGTVVVEAGVRSGARNTASWASALGRVVMAVPGPVTSAQSVTPHRLIRDGEATLVATSDDVRALVQPLGDSPDVSAAGPSRRGDELGGDEAVVREALPSRGGMSVSEVVLASGVPVPRCIAALRKLAGSGFAVADDQGRWKASQPREEEAA